MKRVNVFVDGGARGNPGQAGAGILVENSEGRMIKKILKPLGVATNNEAEYHAVIIGLENALDILGGEAKEAEINLYLDSELVGRQLKGEYRVKSAKLKSLHQKAMGLLPLFSQVSIINIPREKNKEADKLANMAMDQA